MCLRLRGVLGRVAVDPWAGRWLLDTRSYAMAGSITPLPVMLEPAPRQEPEPAKTLVCRYGYMKQLAELPYDGKVQLGCGSKLVIRTPRGIELAEMLTTTCANAGCGKSVSRKQMLQYIEASGGKDFPFGVQGRVLRPATAQDLGDQARLDGRKQEIIRLAKGMIREMDLSMKLVDIEMLLGGERIIFHYTANQWVDFRDLVRRLASEYQTRIEMHQVNARDEARLVADYEKCGQYCCCKQFLKVLKPVSMRSAKVQKATLDPTKISGRCGRLMCCLRYEDETYETMRKRLPHKQTRVMVEDQEPGTVVSTQLLTQLVLVRLDRTGAEAAYPVENIRKLTKEEDAQLRQAPVAGAKPLGASRPRRGSQTAPSPQPKTQPAPAASPDARPQAETGSAEASGEGKRRRRRRRRRKGGRGGDGSDGAQPPAAS